MYVCINVYIHVCVYTLLKVQFLKNCKLKKFKINSDTILKYYKIHSYYLKEYQKRKSTKYFMYSNNYYWKLIKVQLTELQKYPKL